MVAAVALAVTACSDVRRTDTSGAQDDAPSVVTAAATTTTESTEDEAAETEASAADTPSTDEANTASTDDAASSTEETAPGATTPADGTATSETWAAERYGLEFVAALNQPMALVARPGSDDLWVAERDGRVRRLTVAPEPPESGSRFTVEDEVVLDISDRVTTDGERGLLGIDFSPTGDRLYAHYSDANGDSVIASFPMDETAARSDEETTVLVVGQPFSNHNGADVVFGPDDMLYVALGDGGSGNDPEGHGQNLDTLLGAILRIDPEGSSDGGYQIPADNPFVGQEAAQAEIWHWGLRNPFRISFDDVTGELWMADVGQNAFEEINVVPAERGGLNFGWALREAFEPSDVGGPAPDGHVAPILAYDHSAGRCSITGGHVYRGPDAPTLTGVYLYSDYCRGGINGVARDANGTVVESPLRFDEPAQNVIAFGRGPDGGIYVLEQGGGVSLIGPPILP